MGLENQDGPMGANFSRRELASANGLPEADNAQEQAENWKSTLVQTKTPDQLFDWIGSNPLRKHGQQLDVNLMQQVLVEATMLAKAGKPGVEEALRQIPSNSVREQAARVLQNIHLETKSPSAPETSEQILAEIGLKFPVGSELAIRKLTGSGSEIADGEVNQGRLVQAINLQTPVQLDSGFRTSSIMEIRRSSENSYVMVTRSGSQYELMVKESPQPEVKQPQPEVVPPVVESPVLESPPPAEPQSTIEPAPKVEPAINQEQSLASPPPTEKNEPKIDTEIQELKKERKRLESLSDEIQRRLLRVPEGVEIKDYERIIASVYQELLKEGMWEPNLNYDKNTIYDLVIKTMDKHTADYFNSKKSEAAGAVEVNKLVDYDLMESLIKQVDRSGTDIRTFDDQNHFLENLKKFTNELGAVSDRFKQNGIDEGSKAGQLIKRMIDKRNSLNEGRGFRYHVDDGRDLLRWWQDGKDIIASAKGKDQDPTKWADDQIAKVSPKMRHIVEWISTQQQLYQVEDQLRARQQNPENPQSQPQSPR